MQKIDAPVISSDRIASKGSEALRRWMRVMPSFINRFSFHDTGFAAAQGTRRGNAGAQGRLFGAGTPLQAAAQSVWLRLGLNRRAKAPEQRQSVCFALKRESHLKNRNFAFHNGVLLASRIRSLYATERKTELEIEAGVLGVLADAFASRRKAGILSYIEFNNREWGAWSTSRRVRFTQKRGNSIII